MDTHIDERRPFDHITRNLKSTVDDVNAPGSLSLDLLEQVRERWTDISGNSKFSCGFQFWAGFSIFV